LHATARPDRAHFSRPKKRRSATGIASTVIFLAHAAPWPCW
jgi:hypothetical protein